MACNFLCLFGRYCVPLIFHTNIKSPAIPLTARHSYFLTRSPPSSASRILYTSSGAAEAAIGDEEQILAAEKEGQDFESHRKPFFPKRGQTVELVCESLGFKGIGICKVADTGFVVMCDRALPGERFLGRISRRKGSYAEAVKLKTITPHRQSVVAPCEHAADCGGCKTQNLAYEAQVREKEQQVRDLITNTGRFPKQGLDFEDYIEPILRCNVQFNYRNKMEFSFGTKRWVPQSAVDGQDGHDMDNSALGLHVPGCFDKILHINKCLLQDELANHVPFHKLSICLSMKRSRNQIHIQILSVLAIVQENWKHPMSNLSAYNVHTHSGFLKHLTLRKGRDHKTGMLQLMVNFVTSCYNPELLQPIVCKIVETIPEVVSIVNNVNTSVGSSSVGEEEHVLYGNSTITECLRGLSFEISANSFFQTNTCQAEVLYKLIEEAANLRGDGSEIVLDLFCGTGTIGLTLAKKVKFVYGYEVVPQAVADAHRNAKRNDIQNAKFFQGDLNKIGNGFGNEFPRPDIIITDPNRPGMHPKLIRFLLKLQAPRIVYVSCNPATCARDLDYLCHGVADSNIPGAYQLRSVQPVDMFPHTPHIECVCLLELSS